ncbi:MAG TPA: hypothetical protein VHE36_11280 [Sphingomicrobium sp.]|jgi:hypothetical protein|nr:hypothetical protein [Sphingomicrobium sp.]
MTDPKAIAEKDDPHEFLDQLVDELLGEGGSEDQDEDSGDANSPPNFWLGPINTGPLSNDKSVDDPVTSGSDIVDQDNGGIVDKPVDQPVTSGGDNLGNRPDQ